MNDPFVDEIRRYREAHAARFNYDLGAIYRDIKEREKEWEKKLGRKFVSFASSTEPPSVQQPTPSAASLPAETTLPGATPANAR